MKFKLKVMKRFYTFGHIEIEASSKEEAETKLVEKIDEGKIRTEDCQWQDELGYEEGSFDLVEE